MKNKKITLKKVYDIMEQYYASINEPRAMEKTTTVDVPYVDNDREFKTQLPLEDLDIKEPVIKTKKGKNVLRDPVPEDDNKIEDIDFFDKKGNEIDEDDIDDIHSSKFDDLYNSKDDTVEDLDESFLFEQNEDEENMNMGEQNPNSGVDPNIDPNEEPPDPIEMTGGDQNQQFGQDQMGGMDMGMGGMGAGGMEQPTLSAENVGKVFELKKIYSRLLSIESQLSFSTDLVLLKLRKFISKAIELFETVISNIASYRKEIDGIIVLFYAFLKQVYSIMKRYYKIREDKKEKN